MTLAVGEEQFVDVVLDEMPNLFGRHLYIAQERSHPCVVGCLIVRAPLIASTVGGSFLK